MRQCWVVPAIMLAGACSAHADPLDEAAALLVEPAHAPLVAAARLDDGSFVAVGGRGLLVHGTLDGWRQATLPVRRALTGVIGIDGGRVLAIGHDALVLEGAGVQDWNVVWSEPDLDAPLLDVWIGDDGLGFAIGAYGLALQTLDYGSTWTRRDDLDPTESHLYAIRGTPDGTLFVVGEFGTILRSSDRGDSWVQLTAGTDATFFGIRPGPERRLLLHGLTGRLYESHDAGESWSRLETGTLAPLYDVQFLADGRAVVVGGNGTVLVEAGPGARTFVPIPLGHRGAVVTALETKPGSLLVFGDSGIGMLDVRAVGQR